MEIKAFPKLTSKGAWRGRAGAKGYGGFYSQQQVLLTLGRAAGDTEELLDQMLWRADLSVGRVHGQASLSPAASSQAGHSSKHCNSLRCAD